MPMTNSVYVKQFIAITVQGSRATDDPELVVLALQTPVQVSVQTERGDIVLDVQTARAPLTDANFLKYVEAGHFDGGVFHRTVRMNNQPESTVKIEVIQASLRPIAQSPRDGDPGVSPAFAKQGFGAIALERT